MSAVNVKRNTTTQLSIDTFFDFTSSPVDKLWARIKNRTPSDRKLRSAGPAVKYQLEKRKKRRRRTHRFKQLVKKHTSSYQGRALRKALRKSVRPQDEQSRNTSGATPRLEAKVGDNEDIGPEDPEVLVRKNEQVYKTRGRVYLTPLGISPLPFPLFFLITSTIPLNAELDLKIVQNVKRLTPKTKNPSRFFHLNGVSLNGYCNFTTNFDRL
ncbi:unnamed protein product [Caenorhabditis sp. 36 PRJEB53466]|nr:unnamed protein product [Caenorhabditis sp. 36 PRJEB53466]